MSDKYLPKLGELIQGDAYRDAVHIAVMPVVAGEALRPSQRVILSGGQAVGAKSGANWLGVVDPYLDRGVRKGERFWLFLKMNTITALRHHWSHPDVDDTIVSESDPAAQAVERSRWWIKDWAENNGMSYDELMEGATSFVRTGNYMCEGSRFEGMSLPEEFWAHYQLVAGVAVPDSEQHSFFSCSC